VDDELHTSVSNSLSVFILKMRSPADIELFHVWQLHDKRRQLRHLFQCVEDCLKALDVVCVVTAFDLLCSAAKTDFRELLHFTQFLDAVVTETAMF
jgi:hypothetical protein